MPTKQKHRGSPIISLRIPPLVLAAIRASIQDAADTKKSEPETVTTWLLEAAMMQLEVIHQRSLVNAKTAKKPAKKRRK